MTSTQAPPRITPVAPSETTDHSSQSDVSIRRRSHGHRTASWLVSSLSLAALGAAAAVWAILMPGRWLAVSTATVVVVFLVLMSRGHFRVTMTTDATSRIPSISAAVASGGLASMLLTTLPVLGQPTLKQFVVLLVMLLASAVAARIAGVLLVHSLWSRGFLRSSALVVGCDRLATELAIELKLRRSFGVDIAGFLVAPAELAKPLPAPTFSNADDLAETVRSTGVDRLIIGPSPDGDDDVVLLARGASSLGVAVWVVPRFYQMGLGLDSMAPDRVRGYPLVRMQRAVHPQLSIRLKRLFDIATSATVLLLSLPVMAATAALVKLTSPGPVLFSQERVGQHGQVIHVRKFRSMTTSATSDTEWTADSRVTPVGKWLRRLNIDELPQLWLVLVGEMSLVGPRPERPAFVEKFRAEVPHYNDRHRMPVGITGLAQVIGLRGDTSIAERVKYDNLYIDQWSFRSDLQILGRTIAAVLWQDSYAKQVAELEEALGGIGGGDGALESHQGFGDAQVADPFGSAA